jgi:hypothetical protein
MIKTNENRLAKFKIQGSIMPPCTMPIWCIGHDGRARMVPATGGITLNFKVGDLANRYVSDHLEPGVSSTFDANPKERSSPQNGGYNTFSCIGNVVEVVSGRARGAKGVVTGHHGGAEHVMIDFDDKTLDKLTYDDKLLITSFGVGLEIADHQDISVFSLSPGILSKMDVHQRGGKLEIGVAAIIPAVVMGSGLGSMKTFSGDYDIQTSDADATRQYGLDRLRLGDIVAIMDHDSRYGWSYKQGAVSIGVIIHGDSMIAGHGPGCQTIMTTLKGSIVPKVVKDVNIGRYLKIGRYRSKK